MRNSNVKIYISGAIVGIIVLGIIIFLLGEIKKSSQELISQKRELVSFEQKSENVESLYSKDKDYQKDLEKINNSFVDPALPIDFIKFLEQSAPAPQGSVKISLAKEAAEPGGSLFYAISFSGLSSDLLKFIEKVENGPYLVEVINLNIKKGYQEGPGKITANLELTVLSK